MTTRGRLGSRSTRRILLILAIVAALLVLWIRVADMAVLGWDLLGGHDFIEYWSGARILLRGGNPYDPATLLAVELAVGWDESVPLMMWNPPWTLALVLPLAFLPYGPASAVWFLVELAILLVSGAALWRYFAPGDRRIWIGLLAAALFVPGLFALNMGQISPWLLAGVVGFLAAQRSRRDLLAGGALALLMIKPHVTYLFWLAALYWILRGRRWRILVGWLGALLAAGGLVMLFAPDVVSNFLGAASGPPLYWATTTLGTWLRMLLGPELQWLQFLPAVLGLLGLAVWLVRRRGPWRWKDVASPLLLASVVTMPFGWSLDQVVLLPVVMDMVSRLRWTPVPKRAIVVALLVASQLVLVFQNLARMSEAFFVWHPLVLVWLYWWTVRRGRGHFQEPREQVAPEPDVDRGPVEPKGHGVEFSQLGTNS